jgi:CDP-diacylglycerol pyrophosphatase
VVGDYIWWLLFLDMFYKCGEMGRSPHRYHYLISCEQPNGVRAVADDSRNTGLSHRFVCLPHSLQTKTGLKVAVASLSRHQKFEHMSLFTLLDSLTQQGKVRSWVLLGCRNHQPTFPCFIYQQSAIPYVALAALPDSRR